MSRRLRLLLTTDAVGGVWTYSLELAAALAAAADVSVVLATFGPAPSTEQQTAATAIPGLQLVTTELPLDWTASEPEQLRLSARELAELARSAEVDLVQLHTPALAIGDYPAPVLSVVHSCLATWWEAVRGSDLPEDFAWRTKLARKGLERSDLVVTPTRAFARAVQTRYGLPSLPHAVHNGRADPRLPGRQMADLAFTAGRLWDDGKNVAAFDRAAALSHLPFRAAGPLRGPNAATVRLSHATALGALPPAALAEALAERPIFVSTALYEPFGLSVLEAAQAGCALVLSDIPTLRELWDGAAIFVDPTPEEIAATVDLLASTADKREELGKAAQERAVRYTPQATARAMLEQYPLLLGHGRRAAA